MKRRAVLAGVSGAFLLAGCTDLVTDGEMRFDAEPAFVSEAVQDETDYREQDTEEMTVEEELPAGRRVAVTNVITEYARAIEVGPVGGELARFTVLSTPQVSIAGQALNPVDDMDNRELAEMLQEEYDEVENIEEVDRRDVELFGSGAELSQFEAEARTGGQSIDVFIDIARADSGEDIVISLGVYPQQLDEEAETIDRLVSGIEHPA